MPRDQRSNRCDPDRGRPARRLGPDHGRDFRRRRRDRHAGMPRGPAAAGNVRCRRRGPLGRGEREFLNAYNAAAGEIPDYPAIQAAASASLAVHCARQAGSADRGLLWQPQQSCTPARYMGPSRSIRPPGHRSATGRPRRSSGAVGVPPWGRSAVLATRERFYLASLPPPASCMAVGYRLQPEAQVHPQHAGRCLERPDLESPAHGQSVNPAIPAISGIW